METRRIARPCANRVEGRIEETDRWFAVDRALLIHQGREAGPQRRRTTGAAYAVIIGTIGPNVNIVGDQSHIGNVALGRRPLVERHADALLPGRDWGVRADPATAAVAITHIPNGFRDPDIGGTGRG